MCFFSKQFKRTLKDENTICAYSHGELLQKKDVSLLDEVDKRVALSDIIKALTEKYKREVRMRTLKLLVKPSAGLLLPIGSSSLFDKVEEQVKFSQA